MKSNNYRKLSRRAGIYQNRKSKKYLAKIKVNGKVVNKSFDLLEDALVWRNKCKGNDDEYDKLNFDSSNFSTLKQVWDSMQQNHFPFLATSTVQIWKRRYEPLKSIEHLTMDQITQSKITSWIKTQVQHYKGDEYIGNSRGNAKRCNMDNELNLYTTIFNWYKKSEEFEHEALSLINPIKTHHKEKGVIRVKDDRDLTVSIEDVDLFFSCLPDLYLELASLQFYTASRIGEMAGLQWNRIDFKRRRMTIQETCCWDMSTKTYLKLNPTPKNKLPKYSYITDEIWAILKRREVFKIKDNNFVFHVEGKPLNYGTILTNYRKAQRISGVNFTGTHVLRHGMAKVARKVCGGLDAVMSMTGHQDMKLADHYSKLTEDDQKENSEKIMNYIRDQRPHHPKVHLAAQTIEDNLPKNVISFPRSGKLTQQYK